MTENCLPYFSTSHEKAIHRLANIIRYSECFDWRLSPVWLYKWICNALGRTKRLSQTRHLYFFCVPNSFSNTLWPYGIKRTKKGERGWMWKLKGSPRKRPLTFLLKCWREQRPLFSSRHSINYTEQNEDCYSKRLTRSIKIFGTTHAAETSTSYSPVEMTRLYPSSSQNNTRFTSAWKITKMMWRDLCERRW
jgi:hypothetical protein